MDLRDNNPQKKWKNREFTASFMLAKNAKDMAAGAVLVVSCYALITGMIVFIPKIWNLIFN